MLVSNVIMGVILILLGILVKKYPDLIAGYNTMSKEKKKNVDIEGMKNFLSKWLISLGLLIVVSSLLVELVKAKDIVKVLLPSGILFVGTIILVVAAQKFDHNRPKK